MKEILTTSYPTFQRATGPKTSELEVEIVERKGLGHPDTMCDNIMERVAQALAAMYLDRTGAVRHFNCDKALLAAGDVRHRWNGGSVLEPMRLIMGDRATTTWEGKSLDVEALPSNPLESGFAPTSATWTPLPTFRTRLP